MGWLMAAQNLILGAVWLKNAVFQDLDPLLGIKKCDERAKPLKTESPNTYPSKLRHTSSPLYFLSLEIAILVLYGFKG